MQERPLGVRRRRLVDNIKRDLREIAMVDWIELAWHGVESGNGFLCTWNTPLGSLRADI
jgi:hypothetical protein